MKRVAASSLTKITATLSIAIVILIIMKAMKVNVNSFLVPAMLGMAFALALSSFAYKQYISKALILILIRMATIGMSILYVGVMYRYFFWMGWENLMLAGMLPFLPGAMVLVSSAKIVSAGREARSLFIYSFILPMVVVVGLAIVAVSLPDKTFYNTFTMLSKTMSYEEYMSLNRGDSTRPHIALPRR